MTERKACKVISTVIRTLSRDSEETRQRADQLFLSGAMHSETFFVSCHSSASGLLQPPYVSYIRMNVKQTKKGSGYKERDLGSQTNLSVKRGSPTRYLDDLGLNGVPWSLTFRSPLKNGSDGDRHTKFLTQCCQLFFKWPTLSSSSCPLSQESPA